MDAIALTPQFGSVLGAVFVVGLLGGVHCIGMCGGIVAALSAGSGTGSASVVVMQPRPPSWSIQLAFNGGRIAMYALAGAVAGTVGSMALFLDHLLPVQLLMYGFANLMLAGLGLYLLGITRYLVILERGGAVLWRRLQPYVRRVLPATTLSRALALGALWGWMPCGLVYSILATALVIGGPVKGALLLAAFGLGTLPNLLCAGALLRWISERRRGPWLRRFAGFAVLGLGVAGLAHASVAGQRAVAAFLCFTPS